MTLYPQGTLVQRLARAFSLTRTDEGAWKYIVRLWPIALLPSIVIAGILQAIGALEDTPVADALANMPRLQMLLFVLVLAPAVETLILAVMLTLLMRTKWPAVMVALITALIWGLFHLGNGLMIPFVITWPFFVFSMAFLVWRARGWWRAWAIASAIHFLQNLLPGLALLGS